MRRGEADLHALAGAYALDAVSETDRARFEQHLARCEACRQEVRGLREATARLGASAAIRPRAELKARALRAAASTGQLPPSTGDAAGPRGRARWPATPASRLWRGRLLPQVTVAVAAAFLAVAVAMGALAIGAQHRIEADRARGHAIAAVLSAPDVTMLTARVTTGGTATVLESRQRHALVFTAARLRPLPAAERYELWLMGPEGTRPAGMLPPAQARMTGPMVVSGMAAGDRVGLTVEPASGSPRPSSRPIMMIGPGAAG